MNNKTIIIKYKAINCVIIKFKSGNKTITIKQIQKRKSNMEEKITMIMDDGSEVEFTILEQTVLGGVSYILVTDAPDDEDGECYVMKDVSTEEDAESVYESVDDEKELDAVFKIFEEMLKDEMDIER